MLIVSDPKATKTRLGVWGAQPPEEKKKRENHSQGCTNTLNVLLSKFTYFLNFLSKFNKFFRKKGKFPKKCNGR